MKGKRLKWFEGQVLVYMLAFNFLVIWFEIQGSLDNEFSNLVGSIMIALIGFFTEAYHWTFASQYLQTCILIPSIVKKKILLLKMYEEKIENQFTPQGLSEEFLERHDMFDFTIAQEKNKTKKIKKVFVFINASVLSLLFCLAIYAAYLQDKSELLH